jgi:hypothetical protein
MQIPQDALIPDAKITCYLLIYRPYDDKSNFLAKADFTLDNPDDLLAALRQVIQIGEAIEDRTDQYGVYYRVKGLLQGPNGISLKVITVWLHRSIDQQFQFVTLVPDKEKTA